MNKRQQVILWISMTVVAIVLLAVIIKLRGIFTLIDIVATVVPFLTFVCFAVYEYHEAGDRPYSSPYSIPIFMVAFVSITIACLILSSAAHYAQVEGGSFADFIEALVAGLVSRGVGIIGGSVLGYLAGKRVYQRKLKRREEFLKNTSGCLTEITYSEWYASVVVALLFSIPVCVLGHSIPAIRPCLDRMSELESEQGPTYDDYYKPHYFDFVPPVTLELTGTERPPLALAADHKVYLTERTGAAGKVYAANGDVLNVWTNF